MDHMYQLEPQNQDDCPPGARYVPGRNGAKAKCVQNPLRNRAMSNGQTPYSPNRQLMYNKPQDYQFGTYISRQSSPRTSRRY